MTFAFAAPFKKFFASSRIHFPAVNTLMWHRVLRLSELKKIVGEKYKKMGEENIKKIPRKKKLEFQGSIEEFDFWFKYSVKWKLFPWLKKNIKVVIEID